MIKILSRIKYQTLTIHKIRLFQVIPLYLISKKTTSKVLGKINTFDFEPELIRNFSIIAHIDHGKSTLADRLLELTGTITKNSKNKQVLDKLNVERERGITVKAQTASLIYNYKGKEYLLNLIDTPGHVDFSYEVSRSLKACQGTLLLVDATKGVQAQTIANFYLAFSQDLRIVPLLNKVDSDLADIKGVKEQIEKAFDIPESDILDISAKTGSNVEKIFERIINEIPPPPGNKEKEFKALLFDSWYDTYLGAISLVAVVDGCITKGDKITSFHTKLIYEVIQVGIMYPNQTPTSKLQAGQVGYIIMNMKSSKDAKIGDTFYSSKQTVPIVPLEGFKPVTPMVFAGLYPFDNSDFTKLEESLEHLTLNDSSVSINKETSMALGQGWRLGFLGTLHLAVFKQRLLEEYNSNVIITSPTVPYQIVYNDTIVTIRTPADFPSDKEISEKNITFKEPMVKSTIIFPVEFMGNIMSLITEFRATDFNQDYLDPTKVCLKFHMPLSQIVLGFYDKLKSISKGYATFDYEEIGYKESDLVKISVLLNSSPVDVLATIVHKSQAQTMGRDLVNRLKSVIDRQLYEVIIQASIGNKIVARDRIPPFRKNVTAKCYGGDVSRKMKLIEKQKQGKKKLKQLGNVELPQEAFFQLLEDK